MVSGTEIGLSWSVGCDAKNSPSWYPSPTKGSNVVNAAANCSLFKALHPHEVGTLSNFDTVFRIKALCWSPSRGWAAVCLCGNNGIFIEFYSNFLPVSFEPSKAEQYSGDTRRLHNNPKRRHLFAIFPITLFKKRPCAKWIKNQGNTVKGSKKFPWWLRLRQQ